MARQDALQALIAAIEGADPHSPPRDPADAAEEGVHPIQAAGAKN